MRVMVTGAFGNVGKSTLHELIKQGHAIRCFDLRTRTNQSAARRLKGRVEVFWGDLRRMDDVATAVEDQDVVVHLAFIIPKMSATGVESEAKPDWAREINVVGTKNLIEPMRASERPPRLLFTSSLHVYGRTQHQLPPRTISEPVCPTEHYSRHKIACERMVKASGLDWTIFRLAATLPLTMKLDPGMFDVPLNNRMEFVHTRDVGLAIANAMSSDAVWGRTFLIGGGSRCQYGYREIAERILGGLGVGSLPDEAFGSVPFCTDWLDTSESQRLLHYQQRDLGDYVSDMRAVLGYRLRLVRLFRPLVRWWLLRKSPFYRQYRGGLFTKGWLATDTP